VVSNRKSLSSNFFIVVSLFLRFENRREKICRWHKGTVFRVFECDAEGRQETRDPNSKASEHALSEIEGEILCVKSHILYFFLDSVEKIPSESFGRQLAAIGDDDLLPGLALRSPLLLHLRDHAHPFHHLPKHGVFSIQPWTGNRCNKELRSVCIWARIGHRKKPW